MEGAWAAQVGTENGYQYNGKELNEDFGLGLYDYGARWYDPAIGRWGQVDPLADNYFSISPYAYVANNPLIFIDPDGMRIDYGDGVSDEVKNRINNMKENSSVFAALYDYLDTVTDEDGNDIIFTITGGKPRKRADGSTAFGESTMKIGGEIFLSDEATNSTVSEEFFHKFQVLHYGLNESGTVNNRAPRELDAEAKLFNSIIFEDGVGDDRSVIPGYEKLLRDKFFVDDLRDNDNQVIVQEPGRTENQANRLRGENFLSFSYRLYLQDFERGNQFNPAYRGKQRVLTPSASNAAAKLKK